MATQPQQPARPDFPSTDDLCNLSLDDAQLALDALRILVKMELADVYTSAGSNDTRWNVWLNITGRRVPLPEWAAEWCETWHRTTPRHIHNAINKTLYGKEAC